LSTKKIIKSVDCYRHTYQKKVNKDDICSNFRKKNLPLYTYNAIDAKTRIRFRMYPQLEKLQSLKTVINPKTVNFPVLRLEDVMLTIGTLFDIVNNQYVKSIMNKSGKYVIDKYHIIFNMVEAAGIEPASEELST